MPLVHLHSGLEIAINMAGVDRFKGGKGPLSAPVGEQAYSLQSCKQADQSSKWRTKVLY